VSAICPQAGADSNPAVSSRAWPPQEASQRASRAARFSRAHKTAARDQGTPEVQRHRAKLVNGSPPEPSGSGLAIMQAADVITVEHARAAHQYTILAADTPAQGVEELIAKAWELGGQGF
jgi:hypothetical protein